MQKQHTKRHWTDSVWANKKFTTRLHLIFKDEMFDFNDVRWEWILTHEYWMNQILRYGPNETIKHSMERTEKDVWLKATVGNYISKAIHDGVIMRICPGWYMFPMEGE